MVGGWSSGDGWEWAVVACAIMAAHSKAPAAAIMAAAPGVARTGDMPGDAPSWEASRLLPADFSASDSVYGGVFR